MSEHWHIEVEVALRRPPRADATIYFELDGSLSYLEAEHAAVQMANSHPRVVMAVGTLTTDWPGS